MTERTIRLLLMAIIFYSTWPELALPNPIRFEQLTINDKLTNNHVEVIMQDRLGFLWFGSNGLFRYDGYELIRYQQSEDARYGLHTNQVHDIIEDERGMLWISFNETHVNCYDPRSDSFTIYPKDVTAHTENPIVSLNSDPSGIIWFGGANGTLSAFDPQTERLTTYQAIPERRVVWDIIRSRSGRMWLAASVALISFDPAARTYTRYDLNDPNEIRSVAEDVNGHIWVTGENLHKLDPESGKITTYPIDSGNDVRGPIMRLLIDRKGLIWLGTHHGLYCFDPHLAAVIAHYQYQPHEPYSLSSSRISSLFQDAEGLLWIGTDDAGVNKHDPRQQQFMNIQAFPDHVPRSRNRPIDTIQGDRAGQVWFVQGSIIGVLNLDTHQTRVKYELSDQTAPPRRTCMLIDRAGTIWFGAGLVLYRIDRATGAIEAIPLNIEIPKGSPPGGILAITEGPAQTLWLAVWQVGLVEFDRSTRTNQIHSGPPASQENLSNRRLQTLCRDAWGNIWTASPHYLNQYDPRTRQVHQITANFGDVSTITEDDQGRIWLTSSNGLYGYQPAHDRLRFYSEEHGLPASAVMCLLKDGNGKLWLGTRHGLSCFDPQTETFINYDRSDGLADLSFSRAAWQDQNGRMYFGGNGLITIFDPERIQPNPYLPPVVLTKVRLFNQPIQVTTSPSQSITHTETLILPHDQNFVSLEFAALSYAAPEKNQYRYRLAGLEKHWNTSPYRQANFTHLPPGVYTFQVQGSNNSGLWSDREATLQLIITPPWWWNWWSKTGYLVLIVLIVFLIYFARVAQFKKRQRELKAQVAERTQKIVRQKEELETQHALLIELDRFKQGMIAMIVHDLKSPLAEILEIAKTASDAPGMNLLRLSSQRMINLVQDILDTQKFEDAKMNFERKPARLTYLLDQSAKQIFYQAQQKNICLQREINRDYTLLVNSDLVVRVLVNLLTNALKFTPVNGTIALTAAPGDSPAQLRIEIRDTGEGIPADQLDRIFDKFYRVKTKETAHPPSTGLGLTYCKLAVEAHGGQIGVQSTLGAGSVFWLTLPLLETIPVPHRGPTETTPADREIALSAEDRCYLEPILNQLKRLKVYQASAITEVLQHLDQTRSPGLKTWKTAISDAVEWSNEARYEELLAI